MSNKYPACLHAPRRQNKGVALVIVLAFIVLLTGVIVAFFSRSIGTRQISNSSANQTKAALFAQGASDTIIGNLQQEIALSSSATAITTGAVTTVVYSPLAAASMMLPQTSVGLSSTGANLLIRSASGQNFYTGTTNISGNAVTTSSTTPSVNGRYVSMARWNSHYLLPLANATDTTPATGNFTAPNWVLVARSGANPVISDFGAANSQYLTTGSNAILGRYAYAVYHEGGLLDANVAGYPSAPATTGTLSAYKPALAYADLAQIPGLSGTAGDALVAWRNYASAEASQSSFLASGNFSASSGLNYYKYVISNPTGFLRVSGTTLGSNGQSSDRMFGSRQELIRFMRNGLGLSGTNLNCLNYLATFTRDINQPSFIPAVHSNPSAPVDLGISAGGNKSTGFDKEINPNYLTVRVQKSFTRNDGTIAAVGDPLVNKRFALNRLAWLTYKGPSGGGNRAQTDPDIKALIQNGIPWAFIQQGTVSNIRQYFGLNWNGSQWLYNVHNNKLGIGKGAIMRLGRNPVIDPSANPTVYVQDLSPGRDPDFFELLKSAITVGSLGRAFANLETAVAQDNGAANQGEEPYNYNYDAEVSVDRQIMQIGANIINQFRADNFPVQIVFDDGVGNKNAVVKSTATTIVGVANLPYLYHVMTGVLQVQAPNPLPRNGKDSNPAYNGAPGSGTAGDAGYQPTDQINSSGVGAIMQMPVVWNPHDPASPAAVVGPTDFCIVADSTTPDQVSATATSPPYSKFFAYSASNTTQQGAHRSLDATLTSPGSSWFASPSGFGSEIAHPITSSNSEIDFTARSGTVQLFPSRLSSCETPRSPIATGTR